VLPPGSTIGILGGGQLGRMLAVAAAQLGYRCHIFAPQADSVAAQVAAGFTCAEWHDSAALAAFANRCDVITFEFENVPVGALAALDQGKLAPTSRALEVAQDRLREKEFVMALGGRPAPFAPVSSPGDLAMAVAQIGAPGILKTRRDGYDGKGQWRIEKDADLPLVTIPASGLIYEGLVDFICEFSVIMARGSDDRVCFWESPHNTHKHGILARSTLPAPGIVGEQVKPARALTQAIASRLGYVGVLTVEFFATRDGPVFNEMAPRVHNSGHWTIEGATISQFENHIRAICGAPLGDPATMAANIAMENLIGEDALDLAGHLADPRAHVHLYGKDEARAGRKMGHVTYVG